jgi:hypothetical protein
MPRRNSQAIDAERGSAYKEVAEAMISSLEELRQFRDPKDSIFIAR